MACALMGLEKVSDPSLTATYVEPYMTLGITDDAFESHVTQVLTAYSVDSLKMGLQSLRKRNESVRRNGFLPSQDFYIPMYWYDILHTNVTILMSCHPAEEKHEISFLDHATDAITHLGYFSTYPRKPHLLCNLTQDGNYVVLLGPLSYTRSLLASNSQTPVIGVYQLAPPMQLFEKRFKDTPFIKCDPIGIALSPASIIGGQYLIAIVTMGMAVILLNVVTLERSTVQLEFVLPQSFWQAIWGTDCVSFSPDGRFLSVMCCMENEFMNTCLIMDVSTLEPLCWMAAEGTLSWLRWLFPMFSACGTKVVLSTFSGYENEYDDTKYELMFYKISRMQSLKFSCRVVILELVKPSLLDQLPLPQDLITFLGGGRTALQISEPGDTGSSQ
ncbi:PREDICTED: uncharacterized protein LOC105319134, partial [Paramuricea clavata]